MKDIVIKRISVHDPEYDDVWALREEILRKPLNQSLRDDDLSGESDEHIIVAMDGEKVVGCVMLRPLAQGKLKARQMAVATAYQGRGIGAALIRAAEAFGAEGGFSRITLHARKTVVPFYEQLGYIAEGEEFSEVGIPHLFMQKTLA